MVGMPQGEETKVKVPKISLFQELLPIPTLPAGCLQSLALGNSFSLLLGPYCPRSEQGHMWSAGMVGDSRHFLLEKVGLGDGASQNGTYFSKAAFGGKDPERGGEEGSEQGITFSITTHWAIWGLMCHL